MFRKLAIFAAFALCATVAAGADAPQPFASGTLAQIVAARQGRPFILALWSVGCAHCPAELRALAALKRRQPALDVVLVAADSPDESAQAARLAKDFGLASAPQWIFAADAAERLRYEIDRNWHGELPRTYLYDRRHRVAAFSGLVPQEQLARWIRENLR